MKKRVYMLLLLLILPVVSAELSVTSQLRDTYNIGDKLILEGSVISDATDGTLSFILHCENTSIQIAAQTIQINQETAFSQQVQIPGLMNGTCNIYINLITNTTETVSTFQFLITKRLEGNFEINKNEFQLGDDITITGNIQKLDGSGTTGSATIYLKKDGMNYKIENADLNNNFTYNTKAVAIPSGQYSVDASIVDQSGNEMYFTDVLAFAVYNELYVNAILSKDSYLPEETININGTVTKKLGSTPTTINIKLTIDNKTYILNSTSFSFSLKLDKNIKSNQHEISIYAEDEFRNIGTKSIGFNVIPVPTKLELLTEKQEYLPSETAVITVNLYDQANDLLEKEAFLRVINPKYKTITKENITTKSPFNLKLAESASPGEWTILATSEGLNANLDFTVKKFEAIQAAVNGQIAKIKNIGNVKYLNSVDIIGNGKTATKWVSLDIGEETEFDLAKYFDTGTYSINIAGNQFENIAVTNDKNLVEKAFDRVYDVTGNAVLKSEDFLIKNNIPGIFFIFILAGLLTYTIYRGGLIIRQRSKLGSVKKEIKYSPRREPEIEIRNYGQIPSPKYSFGHATEDDIKDFKKIMFKKVMPEEEIKKSYYFEKPRERREYKIKESSEENKGLFSMFD
ncbi:MAG: hypothetical protein AB1571_00075 [Nanoarchaeota archaeon]